MRKRQKTTLERLLAKRTRPNTRPTFIRKTVSATDFYQDTLEAISQIEENLVINPGDPTYRLHRVIYELFPLIDSISYNLFDKSSRYYLKQLGYTDGEADIMIRIFRNGYIHSRYPRKLEYSDGSVSWSILNGGGNTSPLPYSPGYSSDEFPEDNEPPELVLDYVRLPDGSNHAFLAIDRLLAHVRYDIEERHKNSSNDTVDIIVGEIVNGRRRTASRELQDTDKWR